MGQVDGRRGLVPAAYLTSAEDDTHTATPLPTVYQSVPTPGGTSPGSTTPPARTCCVMKVVREYVPSTMSPFSNHEDELPVAVGQTAVVHGRVGDDGYVVAEVDGGCVRCHTCGSIVSECLALGLSPCVTAPPPELSVCGVVLCSVPHAGGSACSESCTLFGHRNNYHTRIPFAVGDCHFYCR